jgi:carbon-monoxide dehydrogenase medium subunit
VKPAPFAYHAPELLDEALALLADDALESRVVAGGQSLVPMMNFRLAVPEVLVDINRIAQLRGLTVRADGALVVGAGVRQATLLRDPVVAAGWPLLVEGVRHVGHPQVRSRGTVCGSLAHHDPTAELPALALALGATMTVASADGTRTIAAADFFTSYYEVALEPGEMLVEAVFPAPAPGTGWAFREIARRRGDFALVGAACVAAPGAAVRVVLFGVGERPVAFDLPPDAEPEDASDLVAEAIDPADDTNASAEYRRETAAHLAATVLAQATGGRA